MKRIFTRLFHLALFAPALLVGAGCASTATPPPGHAAADATAPREQADDLPRVALTPEILYQILLGEIAGQRGQVGIAASILMRVAEQTRDPRLAERATLAALYAKQYALARRGAELWVRLRPADGQPHEALAQILLELGELQAAQAEFERILDLEAERGKLEQGFLRVGSVLGRHNNPKQALALMRALVARHADVAPAHFYAAHLAVRAGDLEQAATFAARALALRPQWEEAALFRARVLISQKDTTGAAAFYRDYLERYPRATNVRLNYARFLIDQKQWEEAHRQFKQVVADRPDDAEAVYAVGLLSLQVNRVDEAEEYLKRALALDPENDQARLYLGQAAESRKRYDEAARWYGEVRDGEHYFEAQMRLAIVMARQGEVEGGRAHLRSIVPQNNSQRVQRALAEEQILREAKRYHDALAVLDEAIAAVPNDKDLLYARALVAERLDRLELAERDLRAILAQDPNNAHALNALGYMLADRTTRYAEAYELIKRALELKPDDPFILDSMGWVQYRLGNYAEAVKFLKRALVLRNDAEIAAHLGEVLWVMGRIREAESVWNRALEETPDNETLLTIIKKFKP
jgi:Tfp pilus assembly protein PilF